MSLLLIFSLVLLAGSSCSAESARIVGGEVSSIERYPSLVQLDALGGFNPVWTQYCAANILNPVHLLTAAHCVAGSGILPLRRLRVGATYKEQGGVIHYLSSIITHPEFGQFNLDADIALIKVENRIIFSEVAQPIAIPPQGRLIPDNVTVVLAGWGDMSESLGSASDVLREVSVYTVNNDRCREIYEAANPPVGNITRNMICSGLVGVGGQDSCYGDSGGPLYYNNILFGIISWGNGCADDVFPSVNIAVSSFTHWIIENAV